MNGFIKKTTLWGLLEEIRERECDFRKEIKDQNCFGAGAVEGSLDTIQEIKDYFWGDMQDDP